MITLEQIMEIKILNKHGNSLRTIAGELGVSVNTVRKYLKYDGILKYKDRPKLVTKLAPYKDYLSDRIKSARPCTSSWYCTVSRDKRVGLHRRDDPTQRLSKKYKAVSETGGYDKI